MEFGNCDFENCTIKRYGDSLIEIIHNKSQRGTGYRLPSDEEREFTGKLENNLVRAKTKIRDYVLCNEWDWWVTLTINPQWFDRYNLKEFFSAFAEMIHNYNRRAGRGVKYLLVPEKHKDGAWHLHGFMYGIPDEDIEINQYGYFNWVKYSSSFGYISMSRIRDKLKAANYITKYLTKDILRSVTDCGAHSYYCSKGLSLPSVTVGDVFLGVPWDYEGLYCDKVSLTSEQLKYMGFTLFQIYNEIPKNHLTSFPLYDIIIDDRAQKEDICPVNESLQIKMVYGEGF